MSPTIYGIHHLSNNNVGDRYCRPWRYCSDLLPQPHRLIELGTTDPALKALAGEWVILGGGGMLHPWVWNEVVLPLLSNGNRVVAWGIGHHHDGVHAYQERLESDWGRSVEHYGEQYAPGRFALCGYRDAVPGLPYAPCCTCMDPAFDGTPAHDLEAVIYEHGALPPIAIRGFPRMSNVGSASLAEVAAFLGRARTVITNSYHGTYWATLLGCRVVIYEPWCTKFSLLRYPHPAADRSDWEEHLSFGVRYPRALSECRAATVEFAQRLRRHILGLPSLSPQRDVFGTVIG